MTNVPISICGMTFFPENLNGQVTKDLLPSASDHQKVSALRTENIPMRPKAAAKATEQLFPKGGRFLKLMSRFPFYQARMQSLDVDAQSQGQGITQGCVSNDRIQTVEQNHERKLGQ
ncbi:hypothetical protein [Acaryochloris thomasi]|uniref:hypothetical protein n=1 Tax=Acaryochloris thomasi TaxID=2929456 RepID=UPI000DA671D9|nr:hypothetical protein [Acaryochloris thomasi]